MLIAQERLSGKTVEAIAGRFAMSAGTISLRLRRLGFNSRDIAFDRGSAVTGRAAPRMRERPICITMARKVLKLRERLRKRNMPSTSGRPSKLLPSERSELPGKYRDLHGDLKALQMFLCRESKPSFDRMWD